MKSHPSNRFHSASRSLILIVAGCATLTQARAVEKTWVDTVANNTWNTIATDTWTDATAWSNDTPDSAIFGGSGETVTLGEPISANAVTFNAAGYTLTNDILTLSGTSRTINANANVRIDSEIVSSEGNAFVRGSGALTLGGRATMTGGQPWEGLYRYVPADSSGSIDVVADADVYVKSMSMMQDNANNCKIRYNQSGGTVVATNEFGIGGSTVGGSTGSINTANISGGTLSANVLFLYKWANSTLNVSNAGVVNVNSLRIGWVDSSPVGSINIGDGTNFSGGTSIQDGGTSGILNVVAWDVRNNRSYTLNFNGGTLQAADNNASLPLANTFTSIAVQEAGGIIDNDGYNISYAQNFAHGGAAPTDGGLVFKGSGTTTLSSIGYTGPTKIEAGTVKFANSSNNAAVTIAGGAAFSCNGTIGNTTLGNGGSLEAGVAGTGVLTTGDLTIGAAAGNTAKVIVTLAAGSTPIAAQGLTFNGGNGSVMLNATGSGLVNGSNYDVMSYTTLSTPGASSAVAVFTTPSRVFTPVIDTVNKKIQLHFDANAGLDWTGTGSSEWSYAVGLNNWKSGGTPTNFLSGDFVTFGNVANTNVEIAVDVAPGGVTFDNDATHNYLVSGNYGIVGGASVTKKGVGTVTINTMNTYTGPTVINAGTFQLGDASFNGTLSPASVITNNATLAIYNDFDDMVQGTGFSAAAITGSGSLLKLGAGTLVLNASNNYSGGSVVSQGNLQLSHVNAAGTGGAITLGDANTGDSDVTVTAALGNGNFTNPITVSADGTGTPTISQTQNFSTLSGTITLNRATSINNTAGDRAGISGRITGDVGTLTFTGNRVTLEQTAGTASDFTGDVVVDCQVQLNSLFALPATASVTVNSGKYFRTIAGANIDALNGSGTINNNSGRSTGDPVIVSTVAVGNDGGSGEFSGVMQNGKINDHFAFTKNGSGTQILSGANTYTGATTINAGTLQIDGTNSGTGAVTVKSNATLAGSGSISGSTTIEAGGIVAPGNTAIGTLTVAAATLSGTYNCQIDGGSSDMAVVTGLLTTNPGAAIHISTLSTPSAASYTIATYGSTTGDTPAITGVPNGYEVDMNTFGEIKLVSTDTSGYNVWANSFPGLTDTSPGGDPDYDGIKNLLEYVIGGDPRFSSTQFLPTQSIVGNNLVLSYTRSDSSEADTIQVGQWSTDLKNWTNLAPVLINENGSNPDNMEIRIPLSNEMGGKLFGRLHVSQP